MLTESMEKTMEDKKKKDETEAAQARKDDKLSRREAMKRMAKGIALVGTLGVAGVVTQGPGRMLRRLREPGPSRLLQLLQCRLL